VKRFLSLLSTAAVTIGLAACGEKKDALTASGAGQPLTVMLDWFPNADHVGLYQALANGTFTSAGLHVQVRTPSDPSTPLQLLAAGKVDVAISYEPEVLLARNQGLPLVSIGAIVQKPLTSIVSVGSKHIRTVAALRGKTVGDAGIPYQHAYLTTILQHAGISPARVREVNVGANLVPAMISGRVDATLGAFWNYEAIQLTQLRKHPDVIRVDRAGVPTYDELVVVVRRATIAKSPDELRRFIQALGRGYQQVRGDPSAGVNALLGANPGLDRPLQTASVKATLPAFFPTSAGKPWGYQDPAQWNAYGQWMMNHHLISNPNAIADASTNELLAGSGP
jgi:putative hydroxymethylpyrimidine transport system substrate-binding protein